MVDKHIIRQFLPWRFCSRRIWVREEKGRGGERRKRVGEEKEKVRKREEGMNYSHKRRIAIKWSPQTKAPSLIWDDATVVRVMQGHQSFLGRDGSVVLWGSSSRHSNNLTHDQDKNGSGSLMTFYTGFPKPCLTTLPTQSPLIKGHHCFRWPHPGKVSAGLELESKKHQLRGLVFKIKAQLKFGSLFIRSVRKSQYYVEVLTSQGFPFTLTTYIQVIWVLEGPLIKQTPT